jgi:hypothetical protein
MSVALTDTTSHPILTRISGFELASSPTIDEATRRQLMTFCIVGELLVPAVQFPGSSVLVGGGPTGIEFATGLHDFVSTDVRKRYPELVDLISIRVYDVAPDILRSVHSLIFFLLVTNVSSMFDESMRKYASRTLQHEHVDVYTTHHVERVEPVSSHVGSQLDPRG